MGKRRVLVVVVLVVMLLTVSSGHCACYIMASDNNMMASLSDGATTTDAIEAVGGATIGYAEDRAQDVYDTTSNIMASDGASDAKEAVSEARYKQKLDHMGPSTVSEKSNQVKEAISVADRRVYRGDHHDEIEAFDEAVNDVREAYNLAKGTMTDQAKAGYEAAKERMSKATGDLGAKMRKGWCGTLEYIYKFLLQLSFSESHRQYSCN